ncbi:MAG TPA: hypothetical protein VMP01_12135 [Pirellulaceae bacterium]|nr:hypothetical protein [Pirellulaceae bacterium]
MDSAVKRPWYRLHWVTWVVVVILVWTLINRELEARLVGLSLSFSYISDTLYGWPVDHLTVVESGSLLRRPGQQLRFEYRWHYPQLVFNVVFCLLLSVSTVHVMELRLRSPNHMQLSLRSLLVVTAIAACLAGLAGGNIDFGLPWVGVRSSWLINWYDLRRPVRWPLIFALGCTIYSLGWLALAFLRRAYSFVRR